MPLTVTDDQLDAAARYLITVKGFALDWDKATKTQRQRLRAEVMRLLVALGQHDFRISRPTEDTTPT